MKIKLLILLVFFAAAQQRTVAQYTRYLVQLKDKKGTTHILSSPSTYLSAKAIERRNRQHLSLDSTDLPVAAAYLDSLRSVPNVTILNSSKWLNQVLIRTSDVAAIARINSFPFVKANTAIAPRVSGLPSGKEPLFDEMAYTDVPAGLRTTQTTGNDSYSYGNSYAQIHIHDGEYLHNAGFTGQGITIAVLDAGFFGYATNPVFDSVRLQNRILGTWDYVANEASVNEDAQHGMACFSIIAANRPGAMVGAAPQASFWLFRTEDAGSEYPIEEQNWIAAAEFADSAGVDIISSSVGYNVFDNPAYSHAYAERNGHTAMITIAANYAFKKGMIVVNSAGNDGNLSGDGKYVICPGDGDSVLTIGAVDGNGNIASFSSWGPNGAGKLKPDVVSLGQGAAIANTAGNAIFSNGTSFSCPNISGLIACLWQAYPEFANHEIVEVVKRSAHKYTQPDNRFGYGIPNFRTAGSLLDQQRQIRKYQVSLDNQWIKAYPVPFDGFVNVIFKAPATGQTALRLLNAVGAVLATRDMDVSANEVYLVTFNKVAVFAKGVYYIQYQDGQRKQTLSILRR